MKNLWNRLRRRLLGLSPEQTTYARRGFRGNNPEIRSRLEQVGATFLGGYHAALEQDGCTSLASRLDAVPLERRGFAFEGAAMGLALLDCLTPWPSARLSEFLRGAGERHTYMVHVGVGWWWARWPLGAWRTRRVLDPLLQWLAFDGWGFHEGFFHWRKYLAGKPPSRRLVGYERRAFDQGLGRSWWFVNGGDPELIEQTIAGFHSRRQPDLWSGVGLAATYAGIAGESTLEALHSKAGPYRPHLAQGAVFAAKARERAGNLTDYTDLAVRKLSGLSALEAARLCDTTLDNLPSGSPEPAYEIWRERIQSSL